MKSQTALAFAALMLFFSCKQNEKQNLPFFLPKVVEARGYVVPKDSIAAPKVIPAQKTKVVRAGKPSVVPANTNVHPASILKIVKAGVPNVCTPGQNGFSFPKPVPAIDRPFLAGIPEVVIAKEAYAKEQNSHNFSSFGKLEGLKANDVSCLLEDRSGNLWIGTDGGVSRYDGKSFTHFTEKQGLSNNFVTSLMQDTSGNLWIGTQAGGVNKYDGKRFTHFTEKEGLCNNTVISILQDRSGYLWFGTYGGGVSRYDGKSFTHFTEKEGLCNNTVISILQDRSGYLWFGTYGGGVSRYDGKSFTHFTEKEGLNANKVNSILEDKNGKFWFGTSGGVCEYDGKRFIHFSNKDGPGNDNISWIFLEDKRDNLWFGTFSGGMSKYDRKRFTHFTVKEGLSDNIVRCILQDKRGNLWIGTRNGGLIKYRGETFTHFTEYEGLSNKLVTSIWEDKSDHLWFGTLEGGASKYDGKRFMHYTKKQGLHSNNVVKMFKDKRGNFWFVDWAVVSKYDGKSFTYLSRQEGFNDDIHSILEDKRGDIWFGTFMGGVSRYDGKHFTRFTEKEGLSGNIVTTMLEDTNGTLWFGTYGGGLTNYDGQTFTHFTEKEGLVNNAVGSMLEDKSGNLWIGTEGGVSKYDGQTFTHFTEKEGLSNNEVRSMLEDENGNLWFGTAVGLSKLKKNSVEALTKVRTDNSATVLDDCLFLFKTYTYEDGFSGIGVNSGKTIHEAKDGTIWIGAEDRLTAFHPGEETLDTIPPNIQLTGLTLYNENIPWQNLLSPIGVEDRQPGVKDTGIVLSNGVSVHDLRFDSVSRWYSIPEHISLPYNNNYLTFQFVGITLQSPKKVKYQFKLEGLEENWSTLTNRSEATYGNLPHGRYTFKVKAVNGEGYWSKELSYPFVIRPPWWHTWWVYALYGLLIVVSVYVVHRNRSRALRRQLEQREKEKQLAELRQKSAELQQQATELEMQALRSQMNPHFIFNSLNAINYFILKNETETASDYLTKFSRLIRMVLQNSAKKTIPLSDELETLRLYIDLERVRFKKHFDFTIQCDESLDTESVAVPPLLLQPFVENAIWHGLMHKEEKGKLTITLSREGTMLCCAVTDNGIGRDKAAALKSESASYKKSMGMQITASRLQILNEGKNGQAFLQFIDQKNDTGAACGTTVIIKIPIKVSEMTTI